MGWQWHQLDHIICKSFAPHSRWITMPVPHPSIFMGRMLFLMPNQQCQSTEGIPNITVCMLIMIAIKYYFTDQFYLLLCIKWLVVYGTLHFFAAACNMLLSQNALVGPRFILAVLQFLLCVTDFTTAIFFSVCWNCKADGLYTSTLTVGCKALFQRVLLEASRQNELSIFFTG